MAAQPEMPVGRVIAEHRRLDGADPADDVAFWEAKQASPLPASARPWPEPASHKDPIAALADPWLIEGVWRPGRLLVIAGAEGVGKSHARAELGIRLATAHGALFDHYVIPAKARVLVIEVENGEEEETRREEEILERFGLARRDLGDYWTLSIEGLSLTLAEDQDYIRGAIGVSGAGAVIFDTGSSMVGDEWGAELKLAVRFLRSLTREYGCAVAVVVHMTKPPRERKRGKDTPAHGQELADAMGQWTRQADSVALMAEAGARVLWRMAKRVPPSTLVLAPEGGAFHALEVTAGEDLGAATRDRVLACISTGQADAGSIATYLGVAVRTVRRHVAALRKAGLVSPEGLTAVSPGVTPSVTPVPNVAAVSVSPGVTHDRDMDGDTGSDMSPTPIGGGGDTVTLSLPAFDE